MCRNVAIACAESPEFSHSEREAKMYPGCSEPFVWL